MSYEERKPKPGLPTAVLTIRGSEFRIPHTCLSKTLDCEKLNQFLTLNNGSSQEIKYDLNRPMGPFQAILEYCHNGKLHLPPSVCPGAFRDEFEFWSLSPSLLQKCCFRRYHNFLGEERNLSGFEDMCREEKKGTAVGTKYLTLKQKIWNTLDFGNISVASKIYFYISTIMIFLAVLNIVLITFLPVQYTTSTNSTNSSGIYGDMNASQRNPSPHEPEAQDYVTEQTPTRKFHLYSVDVQCSDCQRFTNAHSLMPFIVHHDIAIGSNNGSIELYLLDCCHVNNNGTPVFPKTLVTESMMDNVTERQFLMDIQCHVCSKTLLPYIKEHILLEDLDHFFMSIYFKSLDCCDIRTNWKPKSRFRKRSSAQIEDAKTNTAENQDVTPSTFETRNQSLLPEKLESNKTWLLNGTILLPNITLIVVNDSMIHTKDSAKTIDIIIGVANSVRDSVQKRISSISQLASNEIRLTTFVEYITTLFFLVEFVFRILSCPNKRLYFCGVLNCIDLILLIASLCRIFAMNFGKSVDDTILEISLYISMFRVFRLFRIVEHLTAFKVLRYSFRRGKGDLCVLIMYMLVAMFIFSNFIYLFENEADFPSIPDAWWWSIVTMTTVGYGDMYPKTLPGKVVGCFCAIFGVVMLSLVIPVFVNTFLTIYEYADYYKTTNDNEISTGNSDYKNDRKRESVAMDTFVTMEICNDNR